MKRPNGRKSATSVLVVEPYFGESHRRLIEGMIKYLPFEFRLISMPPRKWKWRMRGAALHMVEQLKQQPPAQVLFCSSFLSLTDLIALGPGWLREARKVVYFHENQLVYPTRLHKEWDFHFGLTNVTTALAADSVVFNSHYNRNSFLGAVPDLLRRFPDFRPPKVAERIDERSMVLPPPLDPDEFEGLDRVARNGPARIVWNHRWEFDKDPETFFNALFDLQRLDVAFELVVLGENFKEYPLIFDKAREALRDRIVHWGWVKSRTDYLRLLSECDLVVSSAIHEFFGIAVMEAALVGCAPILPNRLVYPDLFSREWLYEEGHLTDVLKGHIENIETLRQQNFRALARPYEWPKWVAAYFELLAAGSDSPQQK